MQKIISLLLLFISANLMAADLSSCETKDVQMLIKNFQKIQHVSMRVDVKEMLEFIYVDCTSAGSISAETKRLIKVVNIRTKK
jgi:hypothetical protein